VFDNHAANPFVLGNLPYDTEKHLDPVLFIGTAPYVVSTQTQKPFKTIGDVIAAAKAKPDTISYLKMHTVLQMIVLKVMRENGIDAFVNPEQTLPPPKLGGPAEPAVRNREANGCCLGFTALLGGPELEVPAGYSRVVYEPLYMLSADKTEYVTVAGTVASAGYTRSWIRKTTLVLDA